MGLSAKADFVGLVTATGEAAAAQGALRVADNVTLRRAGALSCRPSWTSTITMLRAYREAAAYRGERIYIAANNVIYNNAQAALLYSKLANGSASNMSPAALRADVIDWEEARTILYLPSALGVFRYTPGDTFLQNTGLAPLLGVSFTQIVSGAPNGAATWLAANSQVAYRFVLAKTDPASGMILRSRPTGQVIVQNTGGVAGIVEMTLTAPPLGATLEAYRTRTFPIGVTPDDEMQLAFTNPLTGGSIYDTTPDVMRTTTLYTSPSRGGMENANDRPPACAAIELFRGSLFFGNIRGPERLILSFKWSNRTGSATGLGYRTATGSVTNGSPTITGLSATTGVVAGQFVYVNTTTNIYRITNVAGTTLTITPNYSNVTAASAPLTIVDSYTLDGVQVPFLNNSGSLTFIRRNGVQALQNFVAYEITPPEAGWDVTLVIEQYLPGDPAFSISNVGTNLAGSNIGTGITSKSDTLPHAIAWSSPDEPEHVPPKNVARIGDPGKAILGMAATREALFVFKEDGVYRLTGTNGSFRIDPLDPTAICVLPTSIRRLRNTVYFLATNGLLTVGDDGVQIVSGPIQNEIALIVAAIRTAQASSGLYELPGHAGRSSAADDENAEYVLALGSTAQSYGGQFLVFSALMRGFTTFTITAAPAAAPIAITRTGAGGVVFLTATEYLTPTSTPAALVARVAPHGFTDPALVGKLWTHLVAGVSALTGAASVQLRFGGSEPTNQGTITETLEAPAIAGLIQLPGGSLLRHPVPNALRRAWALRVELIINETSGAFVLELLGAESRENIPNKRPTHGTGAT